MFADNVNTTYTYRPDGLRHSKETFDYNNTQSTVHLWDGQNICAEQNANGVFARYLRGVNLIARQQDNLLQYYHFNAHGDVVQRTDYNGVVLKSYDYDAFGVEKNLEPMDSNPWRYCGEYYSSETKDYYLRARSYTPTTGRFTQEDPARSEINWYTYCGNNPLMFVDPSGLVKVLLDYISAKDKANFSYNLTEHKYADKYRKGITSHYTIDITIGKQFASYRAYEIGGRLIVESDDLINDFDLDRNLVEHQSGDSFNSVDDTALAWSLKYYELSNSKDDQGLKHEYGSAIYAIDDKYSFGEPNIGYDSVQIPKAPYGYERVAGIHSHPKFPMSDYNNFSGSKWYHNRSGDYNWVNSTKSTLYLAGPNYLVKAADYGKGKITQRTINKGIMSYGG